MAPLAGMSKYWTSASAVLPRAGGWEIRGVVKGPRQADPAIHRSTWTAWATGDGQRVEGHGDTAEDAITGPYRWAPDGDPDMPHVREVTWHVTDLPRVAFDPDLRHSFGGSVTVCSVTRNHAERRVRAMIDDL